MKKDKRKTDYQKKLLCVELQDRCSELVACISRPIIDRNHCYSIFREVKQTLRDMEDLIEDG
jgi:hypothetical protein